MKYKIFGSLLFAAVFFSSTGISDCNQCLSINTPLSQSELQNISSATYIGQFVNTVLTGNCYGQGELSDDFDNNTLDAMLDGGLLLLLTILEENPPDNIQEIYHDLNDIIVRLRNNGTTAVNFGEIRKYLTFSNIRSAILFYLYSNKEKFYKNYQDYLVNEFLGGLSGKCKDYTKLWFDEIVNGRMWALQMFDSMAKLPPGVLDANINWVGSFKLCTDVYNNTLNPPMKGKYCRASIGFPIEKLAGDLPIDDSIGLTYGMCISDQCDNDQIKLIVSNSLKLMSVFKFAWVKDIECVEKKELTSLAIFFIVLLSILVLWVFIATVVDITKRILKFVKNLNSSGGINEENENVNIVNNSKNKSSRFMTFIIGCSLYTNSEKFFRTDNGGSISCLNGIRFFSMVWIIWGHTYNYIIERTKFFVVDNIRTMQELNENIEAQLIINGMFGVDTFFLMSAFLLARTFLNKYEASNGFKPFTWAYYYISRYWRLAPPFLISIVIYIVIMPYVGFGPLWNQSKFPRNNDDCVNYWWAYVLFINNFVPNGKGTTCMGYLWYIPNDYQFYAVSPLFLILLLKFPKAGKTLLAGCLVASLCILAFLTANVYVRRGKEIALVLVDMWEDVYIKPYCRASPWIVGLFLGYIFYKLKKSDIKVNISYLLVALGWILCFILMGTAIFGGYTNHAKDARRMETFEYALYFSLTRFTWPLAISWIIFTCHYGYGGVINKFLSAKAFVPLIRLSYCAYLIHPIVMNTYNFSQESLFHATNLTLVYIAISHIFVSIFLAYFFTLIFEWPFVALEKLVFNQK